MANKTSKYLVGGILVLIWLFFLYRFFYVGWVTRIIALIILGPYTYKFVYGLMIEKQNSNYVPDERAQNYTPYVHQRAQSVTWFCTQCGYENNSEDRYCAACGSPKR